jgi:YidC/Oxa1 family membrane protein insertase
MQSIWNTIFYQPILNALSFTVDKITFGDLGFAIIVLTIIIKLILSPLTKKSIKSQILMKKMEPELKEIRKNFPNKEEQAKKTFELYKKYKTNPFSGCLVVLIQIPFIIALYYVFYKGLSIDPGQLYSFVGLPESINAKFLGIIDLHGKNIFLAILAGGAQFLQGYLSSPSKPKVEIIKEGEKPEPKTFQEELSNSMQTNIKYFLPVMIVYFSYITSAAVSLYWFISTMFTVVQEWYIRRQILKDNK